MIYKLAKLRYFTFKNGIWIAWPEHHVTLTCDISLCDRENYSIIGETTRFRITGHFSSSQNFSLASPLATENQMTSTNLYTQTDVTGWNFTINSDPVNLTMMCVFYQLLWKSLAYILWQLIWHHRDVCFVLW